MSLTRAPIDMAMSYTNFGAVNRQRDSAYVAVVNALFALYMLRPLDCSINDYPLVAHFSIFDTVTGALQIILHNCLIPPVKVLGPPARFTQTLLLSLVVRFPNLLYLPFQV